MTKKKQVKMTVEKSDKEISKKEKGIIAHRLSTIKNCDIILVMDQGKIIEDGNYKELMNINGFFADLVKRKQVDVV
ncbi:MAG: hypothetical protein K6F55_11620 [Eubacterium sp.]|nr:hypothetical protein [Eubacterium sp.]